MTQKSSVAKHFPVLDLPNWRQAVKEISILRVLLLLCVALLFVQEFHHRKIFEEKRDVIVVRVEPDGQVYFSNPLDYEKYQAPTALEAQALAWRVSRLLLDRTYNSFDKQLFELQKLGVLTPHLLDRFFAAWQQPVEPRKMPDGFNAQTVFDVLQHSGLTCDVSVDDRIRVEELKDRSYEIVIKSKIECINIYTKKETKDFYASVVTLQPLDRRTIQNPFGLIVTDIRFFDVPPEWDPMFYTGENVNLKETPYPGH